MRAVQTSRRINREGHTAQAVEEIPNAGVQETESLPRSGCVRKLSSPPQKHSHMGGWVALVWTGFENKGPTRPTLAFPNVEVCDDCHKDPTAVLYATIAITRSPLDPLNTHHLHSGLLAPSYSPICRVLGPPALDLLDPDF